MRGVGWFQVVMGCGIVGVWAMLLLTGQVPEVSDGQIDIWFHLGAELATGAGLVVAGLLVLRRSSRASFAACVALGALGYTSVNSAGYYAQAGEWPIVAMFGVVAVSTGLAAVRAGRSLPSVPRARPATHGGGGSAAGAADHGRARGSQGSRR